MRVNGNLHDILGEPGRHGLVDDRLFDEIQFSENDFRDLEDLAAADAAPAVPADDAGVEFPEDDVAGDGRLALVTAYHGGMDSLRRDAHIRAVEGWDGQSVKPDDAVFLEMVLPGEEPAFSSGDFPSWINYFRIYGKERNRNLFQKEAMWNLASKLTGAGKMLFLDGDCMPVGCDDYFARIGEACVPGTCVHAAWHVRHEGQPPVDSDYYSCFADKSSYPENANVFPGYGYCITRRDFARMDGFNPWGVFGFGDCLFVWESMPGRYGLSSFARRLHDMCIRRGRPRLKPAVVDGLVLQHNFHGLKSDRGYVCGNYLVSLFGRPQSYCHIDSAGLLAWNDQEFPLKYLITERSRMHSVEEMYNLICDVFKERIDELLKQDKFYKSDRRELNVYD